MEVKTIDASCEGNGGKKKGRMLRSMNGLDPSDSVCRRNTKFLVPGHKHPRGTFRITSCYNLRRS